jgi:Skp family chaperone for outer membrane proteins
VSTTKRPVFLKIAGSVIVLVALGCLLVASGNTGNEQDLTFQEQITSCQTQLAALEQLLQEIRQTNLAQWAGLQSRIEQMRIDHLSQVTAMESRCSQTEEDYIARIGELEVQLTGVREEWMEEVTNLKTQLGALDVSKLETSIEEAVADPGSKLAPALKIAYINAEDAFSVFTDAVSDLRQLAVDKQGEITKLQQQYMASTISKDEYDSQYRELQVELLQAQLNIDMGTIDKMIASSGFSDMKSDLQLLKDEAQPVVDEMKNLVSTVRVGVIDATEFENRYTQVKNAFSQLDQLLTQAAMAKIAQAANRVAVKEGYDLVLRTKNVIVYRNSAKLTDITNLVKEEIEL